MDALNKTTEEYGMRINIRKAKLMRISKNESKQIKINVDGTIYWNKSNNSVTSVV